MAETSTKPYLIRAIHEWCTDNGYRPYIAVAVDENTVVPREFVRNGEIVLNVSPDASNRLRLGNDLIEFEARFNRVARQVSIPVENVTAVYAAETGQGMAFEVLRPEGAEAGEVPDAPEVVDSAPEAVAAPGWEPTLVKSGPPPVEEAAAHADAPRDNETSVPAADAGSDPGDDPPAPPAAKGKSPRSRLTRVK